MKLFHSQKVFDSNNSSSMNLINFSYLRKSKNKSSKSMEMTGNKCNQVVPMSLEGKKDDTDSYKDVSTPDTPCSPCGM